MKILLLLFLVVISTLSAQDEFFMPVFQYSGSAHLEGMAGAFSAMPVEDPVASMYNPAQVVNFNHTSYIFMGSNVSQTYLSRLDAHLSTRALTSGVRFPRFFLGIPFVAGWAVRKHKMDYGIRTLSSNNANEDAIAYAPGEEYLACTFGFGMEFFVRIRIGYTKKWVNSSLWNLKAKTQSRDWGIMASLPVGNVWRKFKEEALGLPDSIIPGMLLHAGYALLNDGGRMPYVEQHRKEVLPKTSRMGMGISIRIEKKREDYRLKMIEVNWASSSAQPLIRRSIDGSSSYLRAPGQFSIWKNLIEGKPTGVVSAYRGWSLELFELLSFSQGKGKGLSEKKSFALGISSKGMVRLWNGKALQNIRSIFMNHVELLLFFAQQREIPTGVTYNYINIQLNILDL